MTVNEIYEKINLTVPMEQRKFFSLLNDTINELEVMYGDITVGNAQISKVSDLSDSISVDPLYYSAIADNILFLAGAGETYKSIFINKADSAHKKLWSNKAKGKIIKRVGW